jgi:phenylpropionate dioxygenase-like ring-hydroxylating dioxygenase large terminal subunit
MSESMNISSGTHSTVSPAIKAKPLTAMDGCQDPVLLNDWHVVGFDRDIKTDTLYPVRLLGRDLVMWRSNSGQVQVWEDLCVHRGAQLSKGSICDNQVVCPYHGWRYDESGRCTLIPSAPDEKPMIKARAFPHHVSERYGLIWTCLGEPSSDVARFDEWHDPNFMTVLAGPYHFKANGFRSLENFLDVSHFPFVHSAYNGVASKPDALNRYKVEMTERGLVSSEIRVMQPGGDARGVPIMSNYTFSVYRPLVGHFVKRIQDIDDKGSVVEGYDTHYATYCAVQPIDETHSTLWICGALDVKPAPAEEAVVDRYDVIFEQDRQIVETQKPERIPADLRYELHHWTDLMGQRYRRWLREMEISYGTL